MPPHGLYERMREEEPVRWRETADGGGFWSLTRHADIAEVSRDNATFSSYEAGIFLHPDQVVPLDLTRNLLLYKDPPDHTKYRKILQPVFSRKAVGRMEDDIRARITRVIEAGRCDFVEDLAVPIPLGVLTQVMGSPTTRFRGSSSGPTNFARTGTCDTEISGQPIAQGDKVVMWYASASRDEDVVEEPHRFDIHRSEQDHNAFGGGGRHFCLGNGLARLELRILFEELTRRMPDLELDGPVQRLSSSWANALTAMPVRFTPGGREAG